MHMLSPGIGASVLIAAVLSTTATGQAAGAQREWDAHGADTSALTEAEVRELEDLTLRVMKAFQEGHPRDALELMDVESMTDDGGALEGMTPFGFKLGLRVADWLGMLDEEGDVPAGERIDHVTLRIADMHPQEGTARALVEVRSATDELSWVDVSFVRRDERWLVQDYAEPFGVSVLDAFVAYDAAEGARVERWFTQFDAAVMALAAGDLERAGVSFENLPRLGPPNFDALQLAWLGLVRQAEPRLDDAMRLADRADAVRTGQPVTTYVRMLVWQQGEQWEQTLGAADALRRYAPVFPAINTARGDALSGLGRREEALDAYRAALDAEPDAAEALAGLAHLLPPGGQDEVMRRLEQTSHRGIAFDAVASGLVAEEQFELVEALCDLLRELDPSDANAEYYGAQVLWSRGDPSAAARLVGDALPRAPADERNWYEAAFLQYAFEAGLLEEAFARIEDPDTVLVWFADEHWVAEDADGMEHVLELYLERSEESLSSHYCRAYLLVLRQSMEQAHAEFGLALAAADDDATRADLTSGWIADLYLLGLDEEAYDHARAPRAALALLTAWYVDFAEADELEAMVERHALEDADDPALPLYRAWIQLERHGPEAALEALEGQRETEGELAWLRTSTKVRALVRLQRWREAMTVAALAYQADHDPFYLALVHACAGEPASAIDRMEQYMETVEYAPLKFMYDLDMEPALLGPEYADFRRRHDVDGSVVDPVEDAADPWPDEL